ncbi:Protein of unknown function [Nocardioides terrae]|uniref:DUF3352 domain-containing protein n=1 Tax=Nocardioides terrae TaxID=574651 RepID=A0A1I1FXC2_9ACTN|nr:DUF3352 domain-containing protein [Nocardioides terrae]SFC04209.1 Protein of unknown function [Nocardioides terrae]
MSENADQPPTDQLVIGGPGAPKSRKGLWIGGGVLGALAIGGAAAAWAAASFFSQGSQPAEALPASTIGYVSVDLDPSGGQKIAALKLARKFPAFKDKVGLQTDDDVREWIFKQMVADSGCKLDFAKDVEPWLGSRAAVAAVGTDKPEPVVVVQTSDKGKAEAGLKKLLSCGTDDASDAPGWAFDGDWVVLAATEDAAKKVVAESDKGTLADDADFQSWTDKAGDSGILTAYAAPAAGQVLAKQLGNVTSDLEGALPKASVSAAPDTDELCSPDVLSDDFTKADCEAMFGDLAGPAGADPGSSPLDPFGMLGACPGLADSGTSGQRMQANLADFGGAAATLRFADDGVELETVGDMRAFGGALGKPSASPVVNTLPDDTAVAFGVALPKGWIDSVTTSIKNVCGDDADPEALFAPLSQATGLDLPGDLDKLLGDSAALALGPDIDVEGLVNGGDPSDVPVALKVRGDKDAIDKVVTKLRGAIGAPDGALEPVAGDEGVALGLDKSFTGDVAKGGKLGSSDTFAGVVPDGDKASGVLYVNFDALDDAIKALASGDDEVTANLAPLKALGISGWTDGDVSHGVFKLSLH